MSRLLFVFGLVVLLLAPAVSSARSAPHLRGAVTARDTARSEVTVTSTRRDSVLRVPARALPRIHLRQRVELRDATLRTRGRGPTRVLARDVTIVTSALLAPRAEDEDEDQVEIEEEDELEVEGTLTSLSPLTVTANGHPFTCAVPSGFSLAGFVVGDRVEMKCEAVRGIQTLRRLELEDVNGDNDSSGPGSGGDDGGSSGHGSGDGGGMSGSGGGHDGSGDDGGGGDR
jgi:uncharacterized membrane protein YgcG